MRPSLCNYYRLNPNDPIVMDDLILGEIAKKRGKSVAQIMLRFQVQRGVIVIPKSIKVERIRENSKVCSSSVPVLIVFPFILKRKPSTMVKFFYIITKGKHRRI